MRFWDSSALVPLLVPEPFTSRLEDLYLGDGGVFVWWGTLTECASAIARLERQDELPTADASQLLFQLDQIARTWQEIPPLETVRDTARRLLRVHDLRAADALQLAAAVLAAENRPRTLPVVCLDARLGAAAQREGFEVIGRAQLGTRPLR